MSGDEATLAVDETTVSPNSLAISRRTGEPTDWTSLTI